jgi:hypothetical protein
MSWVTVEPREYPEKCKTCGNYGFMGCAACTRPDAEGNCKYFVLEDLTDEEEMNARFPPREDA